MSKPVVMVSYGGGTNSTALLIGLIERGIWFDVATFADTGGERPGTYAYVQMFDEWLRARGRSGIKRVQYVNKHGEPVTLEQRSLMTERLPSLAYGFKKCSLRFKRGPQDKFANNWEPARAAWSRGDKVVKMLGFDADEPHRAAGDRDDKKYTYRYPLIEWGWGREECVTAIERAGLPQPGKSSCFFCPATKPREILALQSCHPKLVERALEIERRAAPHTRGAIVGLGRDWTWQSVIDADAAQLKLFRRAPDMACGCYDGQPVDGEWE